jgi:lipopolysaccharide transport system ATP-binding protein
MTEPMIQVENLSKKYRIGARRGGYRTIRETLTDAATAPFRRLFGRNGQASANGGPASGTRPTIWALKDVSFTIGPCDVVGIIGRNGAGKSTLLKILSRITEPTEGYVTIRGRVGSLLEVGTGFHPELTGRENVFLNGAILGMKRAEIARKFDEIVAFAEVEQFIDTPVKHYSSGMYMRLAFAVAAHLETEILLVDEVLAVGDAAFQKKCLGKMNDVARNGRTVLFVSHNMAAIRQLTNWCVYLQAGRVVCTGHTALVTDRYRDDSATTKQEARGSLDYYRRSTVYESSVRFRGVRFLSEAGEELTVLQPGDAFRVEATVEARESHERACLSIWITNDRAERVCTLFSGDANYWFPIVPGTQTLSCTVTGLPLSPGQYTITIGINRSANTLAFDVLLDYPAFNVVLPDLESGAIDLAHRVWGCVHWTQVNWHRCQTAGCPENPS